MDTSLMRIFSVHASWRSSGAVDADAALNVNRIFRREDETLCAWIDEKDAHRFLVSFDLQAADYVDAAKQCLGLASEVVDLEPRVGSLEEVGATDEEGYLVIGPEDFDELETG